MMLIKCDYYLKLFITSVVFTADNLNELLFFLKKQTQICSFDYFMSKFYFLIFFVLINDADIPSNKINMITTNEKPVGIG